MKILLIPTLLIASALGQSVTVPARNIVVTIPAQTIVVTPAPPPPKTSPTATVVSVTTCPATVTVTLYSDNTATAAGTFSCTKAVK